MLPGLARLLSCVCERMEGEGLRSEGELEVRLRTRRTCLATVIAAPLPTPTRLTPSLLEPRLNSPSNPRLHICFASNVKTQADFTDVHRWQGTRRSSAGARTSRPESVRELALQL